MKRILFTVIYPFWFFLANTWVGGVLMIYIVSLIPGLIIILLIPNLMNATGEEAKEIGTGMAIFSLLLSPFFAMPLMALGDYLKRHYEKWNYKTEMKTKMV